MSSSQAKELIRSLQYELDYGFTVKSVLMDAPDEMVNMLYAFMQECEAARLKLEADYEAARAARG